MSASASPDVSGTVFDDEVAQVARSYAEALLNAASKGGEAEAVLGELEEIEDDLIRDQPRIAELFASPSIPAHEKERVLSEAFEGRALPTVVRFLKVLNHHGRLGLIAPIAREARALWDRKQNRRPVTVTSASTPWTTARRPLFKTSWRSSSPAHRSCRSGSIPT